MKKSLLLSSLILALGNVHAIPNQFDIYGVDSKLQKKIIATCNKEIREYDKLSQQIQSSMTLDKRMIKRHEAELAMIKKLKKLGDFSVISLSPVTYPRNQNPTTYSTLDLVQKSDSNRLPKSPVQQEKKVIQKSQGLTELYKRWGNYSNHIFTLLNQNKFDANVRSCPVVHCTWMFDKTELKQDVPFFKAGASKYKKQLVDIIQHSNNDEDRGNAIFLLANTNDYHAIAPLMISLINDPSGLVRNNAMRVLGAIVSKHSVQGVDVHNILLALNYPYVTDRNKAAYVLWEMVKKDKSIHPIVIKESGTTLVNLLKLKQPNNHDLAYDILKEISHKNYSERDYKHWQQWVDADSKQLKS